MTLLFCIIFLCIISLLFIIFKSKNLIISIISSILIVYIILNPKLCIESTISGSNLFFYKVFPSLFPFLILINIIINCDGVYIYSKLLGRVLCPPLRVTEKCSLPLVVSALCGYPLGAKYSCDLYERGDIDYPTCQRLINIASNAGPLFIIGSVGTSMLQNPYAGYLLLISNYISCIIIGLLTPNFNDLKYRYTKPKINTSPKNIGEVLKTSVDNSIKTCLNIAGFIILFSVLLNIIKNNTMFQTSLNNICNIFSLDKNLIEGFILGLIEMTNGCYLISLSSVNLYVKLFTISFLLCFSGFSVTSQVYSFTYKHNLNMKRYIKIKIFQGIIGSIICILLYKIPMLNVSLNAFSRFNKTSHIQSNLLFLSLVIILILPIILYKTIIKRKL